MNILRRIYNRLSGQSKIDDGFWRFIACQRKLREEEKKTIAIQSISHQKIISGKEKSEGFYDNRRCIIVNGNQHQEVHKEHE